MYTFNSSSSREIAALDSALPDANAIAASIGPYEPGIGRCVCAPAAEKLKMGFLILGRRHGLAQGLDRLAHLFQPLPGLLQPIIEQAGYVVFVERFAGVVFDRFFKAHRRRSMADPGAIVSSVVDAAMKAVAKRSKDFFANYLFFMGLFHAAWMRFENKSRRQ